MARPNDLQTSPKKAKHIDSQTSISSSLEANGQAKTSVADTFEPSNGSDTAIPSATPNEAGNEQGMTTSDEYQAEQDDVDADEIAGLINGGSLSGMTPLSPNTSGGNEGVWSRISGFVFRAPAKQSTNASESTPSNGWSTTTREQLAETTGSEAPPWSISQVHGRTTDTLARPLPRAREASEDTSKKHKPKSIGRPDTFDVPQSPPRSPFQKSKAKNISNRAGPKARKQAVRESHENHITDQEQSPDDGDGEQDQIQDDRESPERNALVTEMNKPTIPELSSRARRTTRGLRPKTVDPGGLSKPSGSTVNQIPKKSSLNSDPLLSASSPPKRKRGRPPKAKIASDDTIHSDPKSIDIGEDLIASNQPSGRKPVAGRTKGRESGEIKPSAVELNTAQRKPTNDQAQKLVEGPTQPSLFDTDNILLDPMPVREAKKSSRSLNRPTIIGRQVPARGPKAPSSSAGKRSLGSKPSPTRKTGKVQRTENSDEDDPASELDLRESSAAELLGGQPDLGFIKETSLEKILSIINRFGQNKDGKRVVDEEFKTAQAQAVTKLATRLTKWYDNMSVLKSAEVADIERLGEVHKEASQLLENLGDKTRSMVEERLRLSVRVTNSNKKGNESMLQDVYLHVLPSLGRALIAAAKQHQGQSEIATDDLERLFTLLNILMDVAKATEKGEQPKAPSNNPYKILQPRMSLVKYLRESLYKQWGDELAARKAASRAAKRRRVASEYGVKRKEREAEEAHAEEEEYQQRVRERKRAIATSLYERRKQLGLPPSSQPKWTGSQPVHHQHQAVNEPEEGFYYNSHDRTVREIGLFGQKNSHPGTSPKEWTRSEMKILVDGLRRDWGTTRYETLAPNLDRTLDEIFDRAKYLKAQIEYTLKRLQEENPRGTYPPVKAWIENIGSEGFQNL